MQSTERTNSKERPILFNAEMVRAILYGRKTQTRRAVKFPFHDKDMECELAGNELAGELKAGRFRNSPLGQPGDRLWVRETWGVVSHAFNDDGFRIPWTPQRPATPVHELPFGNGYYSGHVIYRADGGFIWSGDDDGDGERTAWHPSLHMPRKASRIDLLITGVRVERLQDISEEDAKAEGVTRIENNCGNGPAYCDYLLPDLNDTAEWYSHAKHSFQSLWRSIYGSESWHSNPWVWVVEFERLAKDGGQ
ncbi:hypothetical protein [Biostraticola tofi]|uniref:Morphogenetic protein n=1 Tax=Biostraticola tofi TaxID=466109 RepID=A0A4R3Z848_9GAMM|nr:hypothetical protein [Biostraticola tofi]TCW00421.1 hypothetical protein EDC52_101771 [Biostraticola tofi]